MSRSLTFAALGFALIVGGCDRQSGGEAQPQASSSAPVAAPAGTGELQGVVDRSKRGSQLPDFTLSDPAGKQLRLADLKGKPVLINLWATWCAPCVAELPMLDALAKSGTVRVVTVSQDMGEPEKVAGFLAQRGATALEPWLDPRNDLSFHYATGTLPTTIYYDAQGREVWRFIGGHDWSNAETRTMLSEGVAPK